MKTKLTATNFAKITGLISCVLSLTALPGIIRYTIYGIGIWLSLFFFLIFCFILIGSVSFIISERFLFKGLLLFGLFFASIGIVYKDVLYMYPVSFSIPISWGIPQDQYLHYIGFSVGVHFIIPFFIILNSLNKETV